MNKSNESSSSNQEDQELDLGVLFNLLSSFFKSLFKGIVWLFSSIFSNALLFIIYLKAHILKFAIAAFIGALLGGIYHFTIEKPLYSSSMTVQANYESIIQLYNDIDYCEGLISEQDYKGLAAFFKIDSLEASTIQKVKVSPYKNDNQVILAYNDFITKLDSNVVQNIDFEKFSENIPKEEFLSHIIYVESTDRLLFKKLENPIINSLANNPYYSKLLDTEISNLKSQEKVLNISMTELDSLRQFYKEVALAESKKENASTAIYLGNTESDWRDIVVFEKYIKANIDLVEIKSEINLKAEIINVVSSFNKTGSKVKGLFRNPIILGFLGGIFLIFTYLMAVEFNRFLRSHEQKIRAN